MAGMSDDLPIGLAGAPGGDGGDEGDEIDEISVVVTEDNEVCMTALDHDIILSPEEARMLGQALIDAAGEADDYIRQANLLTPNGG